MLTLAEIQAVPKVLLHDHLDGGLRPQTILELARETGYSDLPGDNAEELTRRLTEGAHRGHLEIYLDAFRHTVAVMQTPDALRRVAAECAEDLAADGVVYAEVRFAPELHTERGLSLDEVVQAVLEGFRLGSSVSQARAGRRITVYALLTAMRTAARSLEIAELAVRYRDEGVVGFDIAGAEAGWPPSRHLDAVQYIKRENFRIPIHAGEAFGLRSIWEAVQWCGTERLGHGVRIADDIEISAEGNVRLGRLAAYIRDRRIPLEMCPTSNVQTGAAPSIALHPLRVLRQLSFRVTVNTDNRLMSQVTCVFSAAMAPSAPTASASARMPPTWPPTPILIGAGTRSIPVCGSPMAAVAPSPISGHLPRSRKPVSISPTHPPPDMSTNYRPSIIAAPRSSSTRQPTGNFMPCRPREKGRKARTPFPSISAGRRTSPSPTITVTVWSEVITPFPTPFASTIRVTSGSVISMWIITVPRRSATNRAAASTPGPAKSPSKRVSSMPRFTRRCGTANSPGWISPASRFPPRPAGHLPCSNLELPWRSSCPVSTTSPGRQWTRPASCISWMLTSSAFTGGRRKPRTSASCGIIRSNR